MSAPAWVSTLFAPTLGLVICNVMWLSPLQAVQAARNARRIGELTSLPFSAVATVLNCIGWVIYGCMRRDYFIFFANFPGLCWGLYYCLSCLQLLSNKRAGSQQSFSYHMVEKGLIGSVFFWSVLGMVSG